MKMDFLAQKKKKKQKRANSTIDTFIFVLRFFKKKVEKKCLRSP
jgi:hypothetical protein